MILRLGINRHHGGADDAHAVAQGEVRSSSASLASSSQPSIVCVTSFIVGFHVGSSVNELAMTRRNSFSSSAVATGDLVMLRKFGFKRWETRKSQENWIQLVDFIPGAGL